MSETMKIDWDKMDGLVPVIVQDATDGAVLMLGYMNEAALAATYESGKVTFFSRSKQRLWTKGESSERYLHVRSISCDCDSDTILILADAAGPTCHKGTRSCFADAQPATAESLAMLGQLEKTIAERAAAGDTESSYTAKLLAKGTKRIAQKVGEEGVEVALAAMVGDREELAQESADLLYHLCVLLKDQGLQLTDVMAVLKQRHGG